jgi:hypothetical protein
VIQVAAAEAAEVEVDEEGVRLDNFLAEVVDVVIVVEDLLEAEVDVWVELEDSEVDDLTP